MCADPDAGDDCKLACRAYRGWNRENYKRDVLSAMLKRFMGDGEFAKGKIVIDAIDGLHVHPDLQVAFWRPEIGCDLVFGSKPLIMVRQETSQKTSVAFEFNKRRRETMPTGDVVDFVLAQREVQKELAAVQLPGDMIVDARISSDADEAMPERVAETVARLSKVTRVRTKDWGSAIFGPAPTILELRVDELDSAGESTDEIMRSKPLRFWSDAQDEARDAVHEIVRSAGYEMFDMTVRIDDRRLAFPIVN